MLLFIQNGIYQGCEECETRGGKGEGGAQEEVHTYVIQCGVLCLLLCRFTEEQRITRDLCTVLSAVLIFFINAILFSSKCSGIAAANMV